MSVGCAKRHLLNRATIGRTNLFTKITDLTCVNSTNATRPSPSWAISRPIRTSSMQKQLHLLLNGSSITVIRSINGTCCHQQRPNYCNILPTCTKTPTEGLKDEERMVKSQKHLGRHNHPKVVGGQTEELHNHLVNRHSSNNRRLSHNHKRTVLPTAMLHLLMLLLQLITAISHHLLQFLVRDLNPSSNTKTIPLTCPSKWATN